MQARAGTTSEGQVNPADGYGPDGYGAGGYGRAGCPGSQGGDGRGRRRRRRVLLGAASLGAAAVLGFAGLGAANAFGATTLTTSQIEVKVDPGLVDVVSTLGYQGGTAVCTGRVLTSTGEVLTNNHVIQGATAIKVTDVGDGRTYTAKFVGHDKTQDVAVLQLSSRPGSRRNPYRCRILRRKHSPVALNESVPADHRPAGRPGHGREALGGALSRRHGHRMHERKTSVTWEPPYGIEP
jgi:hypothetical protein